jgi:hypothetical protein
MCLYLSDLLGEIYFPSNKAPVSFITLPLTQADVTSNVSSHIKDRLYFVTSWVTSYVMLSFVGGNVTSHKHRRF